MKFRLKALLATAAVGAGFLVSAAPISAAPITCPNGQTVTKTSSGWECVNNGGHGNPSTEDPKNPNR